MRKIFVLGLCVCAMLFLASVAVGGGTGRSASKVSRKAPPGTVVLQQLADMYGPVEFDHEEHMEYADSCGQCHHQHGRNRMADCGGCHEMDYEKFRSAVQADRFSPCAGCHGLEKSRENPGRVDLKVAYHRACLSCHREINEIGENPSACTDLCHDKRAVDTSMR